MKKLIKNIPLLWNILCGISSLLSLGLLIFGDKDAVIIALSFFCFSLLVVLVSILYAVNSYLKQGKEKDYKRIASYIKYDALDKTHIDYDVFRVVQAKCVLLTKIIHGYKWSGSVAPEIDSRYQKIANIRITGETDDDKMNTVDLCLKEPLLYNETTVVHFNARMDDSDHTAEPFVSYKATECESVFFRVILRYKNNHFAEPATVYKRKINASTINVDKVIATVPFDKVSRSYEYNLPNPEVGYFYKIVWEK